jgi:hypothetical protein
VPGKRRHREGVRRTLIQFWWLVAFIVGIYLFFRFAAPGIVK